MRLLELSEITKGTILSLITEEQIFLKYLELDSIKLDKLYTNVLREDKTPGCSFFIRDTDGRLIFNDFAWRQFDCFDVVMVKYGITKFNKALKIVAADFNLISNPGELRKEVVARKQIIKKTKQEIKIKRKKYTKEELAFWNIGGLIIEPETLEENNIFSLSCFWEMEGNLIKTFHSKLNMVFGYKIGKGYKYQIYQPKKTKTQRRFINSPDIKVGDLDFIDYDREYILVTKSKKDAFFLRMLGVNVIFILHEKIKIPDTIMENLNRFRLKFTLFDNDETGVQASKTYKRLGFIPLLYSRQEGKDTTQILNKFGYQYLIDLKAHVENLYDLH